MSNGETQRIILITIWEHSIKEWDRNRDSEYARANAWLKKNTDE